MKKLHILLLILLLLCCAAYAEADWTGQWITTDEAIILDVTPGGGWTMTQNGQTLSGTWESTHAGAIHFIMSNGSRTPLEIKGEQLILLQTLFVRPETILPAATPVPTPVVTPAPTATPVPQGAASHILITDSSAYDPATDTLYLSSVHEEAFISLYNTLTSDYESGSRFSFLPPEGQQYTSGRIAFYRIDDGQLEIIGHYLLADMGGRTWARMPFAATTGSTDGYEDKLDAHMAGFYLPPEGTLDWLTEDNLIDDMRFVICPADISRRYTLTADSEYYDVQSDVLSIQTGDSVELRIFDHETGKHLTLSDLPGASAALLLGKGQLSGLTYTAHHWDTEIFLLYGGVLQDRMYVEAFPPECDHSVLELLDTFEEFFYAECMDDQKHRIAVQELDLKLCKLCEQEFHVYHEGVIFREEEHLLSDLTVCSVCGYMQNPALCDHPEDSLTLETDNQIPPVYFDITEETHRFEWSGKLICGLCSAYTGAHRTFTTIPLEHYYILSDTCACGYRKPGTQEEQPYVRGFTMSMNSAVLGETVSFTLDIPHAEAGETLLIEFRADAWTETFELTAPDMVFNRAFSESGLREISFRVAQDAYCPSQLLQIELPEPESKLPEAESELPEATEETPEVIHSPKAIRQDSDWQQFVDFSNEETPAEGRIRYVSQWENPLFYDHYWTNVPSPISKCTWAAQSMMLSYYGIDVLPADIRAKMQEPAFLNDLAKRGKYLTAINELTADQHLRAIRAIEGCEESAVGNGIAKGVVTADYGLVWNDTPALQEMNMYNRLHEMYRNYASDTSYSPIMVYLWRYRPSKGNFGPHAVVIIGQSASDPDIFYVADPGDGRCVYQLAFRQAENGTLHIDAAKSVGNRYDSNTVIELYQYQR